MAVDDKSRTRFTLNDLPRKPVFEKGGVQQPVFGKTFQVIEPPRSQPTAPKRFAVDVTQGFGPHQLRVKVPEFKPTHVKTRIGLEGESTRAFKPLVQMPVKGLTRGR